MIFTYLLKRMSPLKVILLMTLMTMLLSVVIVILLDLLFMGVIDWMDVMIGVITPGILGSFLYMRLIHFILKLQRTERELQILANEDYLTHLLNRRRLLELATQEWQRARRYQRPLALLMVDVDHFKAINDTHTHEGGDAALRHLARVLQQTLRQSDLIGRFGGEEFAILLPETDASRGLATAERIRATIEASPLIYRERRISMTVSIGLATSVPMIVPLETLLRSADEALYQAKDGGRNRVISVEHLPFACDGCLTSA